jgi:hypothetical protein
VSCAASLLSRHHVARFVCTLLPFSLLYCTFVSLMPLNLVVDPGAGLACRMCCPQRAAGIESLLLAEAGQDLDLDDGEMHEDGQGAMT